MVKKACSEVVLSSSKDNKKCYKNNVNLLLLKFICMISVNVLFMNLSIFWWGFLSLQYATWYMYMKCLQWTIPGIWNKISELSLRNIINSIAVISFLLTFYIFTKHITKKTIFDIIKSHYLSQFKDAQSTVQQNRKMAPESWYTMTLLNISDTSCRWIICRTFPLYNRYHICHFH